MQYDTITKELFEGSLPGLLRLLDIRQAGLQPLKQEMSRTQQRRPDFLLHNGVEIAIGDRFEWQQPPTYWLQLEIQSDNDPDMLAGMYFYSGFIYQKFGILPRQWVLYLGNEKLSMQNQLHIGNIVFEYHLFDIRALEPAALLATKIPELATFAILANNGAKAEVLAAVVELFDAHLPKGSFKWQQAYQRLRILGKLRNFDQVIEQTIKRMPLSIQLLETDSYYLKGIEKGVEKGAYQKALETAQRMLLKMM